MQTHKGGALLLGLTGIEPITFRYERNILPLNYRRKNYKKTIYKNIILV